MDLFYDCETTGLIVQGERSSHPDQPHIVQVAGFVVDENRQTVAEVARIVRPSGWVIPAESIRVHGITMEQAMDEGIAEQEALEEFLALARRGDHRIAHNEYFDMRVVRIATTRYLGEVEADDWKSGWSSSCTLEMARRTRRWRFNTLNDVHRALFETDVEHAHKAMADALACQKIYYELLRLEGVLPLPAKPRDDFTPAEFA